MILFSDVIRLLQPSQIIGTAPEFFTSIIPFDAGNTNPAVLMWTGPAGNENLQAIQAGIVVCQADGPLPQASTACLVVVPSARKAFFAVMKHFFSSPERKGIHPTACIHPKVQVPDSCYVGAYAVIEEGCQLGEAVQVGHHTVLLGGTEVQNDVKIGCHCTIGDDGFGYEKDENGCYQLVQHIGNVLIEKGVHIGNSVCIDKGTLGKTVIGAYARIDNHVHIAHNVYIGKNVLVIAHAMVAGSCRIEDEAWIAPTAAILQKTTIQKGATVGMGAVVFSDVKEKETVIGNPARVTKGK